MHNILFMRHGESGFDAPSDRERVLTAKGQRDTAGLYSHFIHGKLNTLDAVFCSPYMRTQQSCQLVLGGCDFISPAITLSDALVPHSSPELISQALDDFFQLEVGADSQEQTAMNILIVTHMPLIANALAFFIDGDINNSHHYSMQPGACAHLICDLPLRGMANLLALYQPI